MGKTGAALGVGFISRRICVHFFFRAEDGIRDLYVTGVQTCALPICCRTSHGWYGNPPGRPAPMLMPSLPIGSSRPHVYVTGLMPWAQSGFPVSQIPEKSGLPSAVRGAGADRSTIPSAFRGTPAVGYFNHCAALSVDAHVSPNAATTAAAEWPESRCIRGLPARSDFDVGLRSGLPVRRT